jgi:hypothetical protein
LRLRPTLPSLRGRVKGTAIRGGAPPMRGRRARTPAARAPLARVGGTLPNRPPFHADHRFSSKAAAGQGLRLRASSRYISHERRPKLVATSNGTRPRRPLLGNSPCHRFLEGRPRRRSECRFLPSLCGSLRGCSYSLLRSRDRSPGKNRWAWGLAAVAAFELSVLTHDIKGLSGVFIALTMISVVALIVLGIATLARRIRGVQL